MTEKAESFFYGTGRRKQAVARVWIYHGEKGFTINGRQFTEYLQGNDVQALIEKPLKVSRLHDQFRIFARVSGGGLIGQADAIRLGIARALVQFDEKLRPVLRQEGLLTRDPREKERKKFGRKGARRRFQYTKR